MGGGGEIVYYSQGVLKGRIWRTELVGSRDLRK